MKQMTSEEEIKNNIEIIKPYLLSKGIDLNLHTDMDHVICYLVNLEDKFYLDLDIGHLQGNNPKSYLFYKYTGQLLYDKKGNILFESIESKNSHQFHRLREYSEGILYANGFINYKSSLLYVDDNNLITMNYGFMNSKYTHYKKENGKFEEQHIFSKDDCKNIRDNYSPSMIVLKTTDNSKLLSYGGRLYSISEAKFLNNLEFDGIYDYEHSFEPYTFSSNHSKTCSDASVNVIKKIIQDNNLLFAKKYVLASYDEYEKDTVAFVYLDTKGNIVSKMYFEVGNKLNSVDVTTDSFEQTIEQVKKMLVKHIKKELDNERKKEEKAKTLKLQKEINLVKQLTDSYNK
jgi:hypothetical protein